MKIKETQLNTFTHAGITYPTHSGQFKTSYGFTFEDRRPAIAPQWAADASILVGVGNSLDNVLAAFQDQRSTQPILWIGNESESLYLADDYTSGSPYAGTILVATDLTLGGQSGQNVLYTNEDKLHLIASNGYIYRGPHNTTLTAIYTENAYATTAAWIIALWNDYIYMLTRTGGIYRLETDTFVSISTPEFLQKPIFAIPFRGYLLIGNQDAGGTILLIQFTPESNTRLLYQLPTTEYSEASAGHCVALHRGDVFFTTRGYTTNEDSTISITINRFDGSIVHPVHTLRTAAGTPASIGLLNWKDELILYVLREGVNPTHNFYVLTENYFVPLNSITDTGTITSASVSPIGQQLVFNRMIGSTAYFSVLGTGPVTAAAYLDDATLETGILDFGTNTQKLLNTIAIQLSVDDTNVTTTIKYKIDGASTWATADSSTGGRVAVENLNLEFYTLEIRVEIDTDSAVTDPLHLNSISIIYTHQGL